MKLNLKEVNNKIDCICPHCMANTIKNFTIPKKSELHYLFTVRINENCWFEFVKIVDKPKYQRLKKAKLKALLVISGERFLVDINKVLGLFMSESARINSQEMASLVEGFSALNLITVDLDGISIKISPKDLNRICNTLKHLDFIEIETIRAEFGFQPHAFNNEFCILCLFYNGQDLIEDYSENYIDAVFGYPSFQFDNNIDKTGIVLPSGKFYLKEDFDRLISS